MPQKKQTARKTTGSHARLTSLLSKSEGSPAKRVRYDPLANSIHIGDPFPLRSRRGAGTTPRSSPSKPASRSSTDMQPLTCFDASPQANGSTHPPEPVDHDVHDSSTLVPLSELVPESHSQREAPHPPLSELKIPPPPSRWRPRPAEGNVGTMTRRHPQLHTPISVCIQFASWLETQKCAHEHVLVQAVERDGSQLLALAKATITFDNALRGNVLPPINGVEGALSDHVRTLRVFAQLLQAKISEGTLSEELEKAVLRDGEALLRLALCCLDFERAVQGSS